ncbi:Abi-alpha family protein [Calothrix sp. NIES-2098]|uniref:Abi-alpha family protein n=1 Tax=Calothrix sp. NIES-2098 TaxID=1954171 RepID=UPI000B5E0F01|nr:hypothetical protein NIES2098_42010 [Calothrix sp. NIES-2098]
MAGDLTGIGEAAKAGVELYKESGIKGLMKLLVAPAATELGLLLADHVKSWRNTNTERTLQKAQQKLREKEITAELIEQAPSQKFIAGWVEAASLEDDESMQEKWANLLVAAVSGISIHPKYIETLKLLDPVDANLLEIIRDYRKNCNRLTNGGAITSLTQRGINIEDDAVLRDHLYNLVARDLCDANNLQGKPRYSQMIAENIYISEFGTKFLAIVNGED